MRKLFSFLGMLMLCATLMAQSPSAFKYQAVARNQAGSIMADQAMSVRISILKGAHVEYSETHSVTTNDMGLFTIEVGRGSPVAGTFFDIVWNQDPHFMRVEVDPAGGTSYMFLGISELLSVPYAQHAETVTNNDDADADPDNEIQDLRVVGSFLRITNNPNPTQIDLTQFDTDQQELTYDADQKVLTLENGGMVDLSNLEDDADANPINELQTVTQVGNTVTLSQGGGSFTVDDADANPINELQTLTQSGNTISLSNGGGSVTITENDGDPSNELQDLTMNHNYLYITGKPSPNIINMNHFLDNTDAQQVHYDAQTGNFSIDNGNVVNLSSLEDDADADPANELQMISRVGNDLVLSQNGGTVNIEDGDSDDTNEIQTISQNGLDVTLSNGGGTFSVADNDNSIVNEIQDLMVIGDSLIITNNPSASIINLGNTDDQTLTYSALTHELTIANGNTIDLTGLMDDDDANPVNEIQNLYLSNDSLIITDNPMATVIDLGPYMDNTDGQTLTMVNDSIYISNGNGVDLSSYLDNTDAQRLQLIGNTLSIDDGNAISLAGFMDNTDSQSLSIVGMDITISGGNTITVPSSADNLGNHTATQNVRIGAHYISNDGDSEGIRIQTDGNVAMTGNVFVGQNAGSNTDLYISGRMYDWDDNTYYSDPNFQSRLNDLRVNNGLTVQGGGISVTGNSTFANNVGITGTLSATGAATMASTLGVTGDFAINTNKFTVAATTGNTVVGGAMNVTNDLTVTSGFLYVDNGIIQLKSVANPRMEGPTGTRYVDVGATGTSRLHNMQLYGSMDIAGVITSTVTTGTAPMVVASTTKVDNLNADLLDGLSSADFMSASATAAGDVSGALSNLQIGAGAVGSTELASGLTLAGATSLTGTLGVTGAATLSSSLAVTGNTTVGGTLGVTGDLTASDDLVVTNGATIGGVMNVTGITTLATDLTVTNGDIDINSAKAFYLGDKMTDGSWRIIRDNDDLVFERREAGSWVQKVSMVP